MSQLAHTFPEEYAEIARLPPAQQNAAERALADRLVARTEPEPAIEGRVMVTKNCRDCDTPFEVPAERARHNTKWYSLCGSCLRHEM